MGCVGIWFVDSVWMVGELCQMVGGIGVYSVWTVQVDVCGLGWRVVWVDGWAVWVDGGLCRWMVGGLCCIDD